MKKIKRDYILVGTAIGIAFSMLIYSILFLVN